MKKFNDTGVCIPEKHYMVDTSAKVEKIYQMVEEGDYFTINRPRQFGKTTHAYLLYEALEKDKNYLPIKISFEGIGDAIFEDEVKFASSFLELIGDKLAYTQPDLVSFFEENAKQATNMKSLSSVISNFVKTQQKKIVLLIDEVDKSSNNQLFLSFIGMLRDKYLLSNEKKDFTFQSVILIGVHDVKSLKQKINPESKGKLNSPWNIAVDFKIDLSFKAEEIETMLIDYAQEREIQMDMPAIAVRIYYYTSGYPYLVSKLCKSIAEDILPEKEKQDTWTPEDVDTAFQYLTRPSYQTTLFDDLAKNLLNNQSLYDLVFNIIFNGKKESFSLDNPLVSMASTYGILANQRELCKVHNRIFEQRIYNMMLSILSTSAKAQDFGFTGYIEDNQLLMEKILLKFQAFMQENYASKDTAFLEREGRLLFLSFLKPIINGKGFDFKEPIVGDERRMDIVITFLNQRYVVELKRWEGESYHQIGLQQLSDYLDLYQLKQGYLLIFDFRKNKAYKDERIQFADKEIFAVWT
jgi:hypothetical protein